jgi:polyphosphate glucokinase
MNVLVIDVGGTRVKILATGQDERRAFDSGPTLTAQQMVAGVKKLATGWKYDAVSIGYPGLVIHGRIAAEPHNLASGWIGFDFEKAFGRPVKVINDAAMQALGSHEDGTTLFLGLGTGLGSALVVHGNVVPMELAHLAYRKATVEDYVGLRALERYGKKKWRKHVAFMVERFSAALHPDHIVIGGGNVKMLKELPSGCIAGGNGNAFIGGFRLWERASPQRATSARPEKSPARKARGPAHRKPKGK